MRRIKIGSAKALVWAAVSLAVWCGSAPALAQTYDFTFSGDGVSITDGVLVLANTGNITSVSGTLSGVSPSKDDGTISLLQSGSPNFYATATSYGFVFEVSIPGGGSDDIILNGEPGDSPILPTDGDSTYFGTSTVTQQTPASIPGSGPLSYLAFGLGGLFFYRKRLWLAARMAV